MPVYIMSRNLAASGPLNQYLSQCGSVEEAKSLSGVPYLPLHRFIDALFAKPVALWAAPLPPLAPNGHHGPRASCRSAFGEAAETAFPRASPAIAPNGMGAYGGRNVVVPTAGISASSCLDSIANPIHITEFSLICRHSKSGVSFGMFDGLIPFSGGPTAHLRPLHRSGSPTKSSC